MSRYPINLPTIGRVNPFFRKFGLSVNRWHVVAVVLSALPFAFPVMAVETVAIEDQGEIVWAFDAARPGNNLPPAGESLFDSLFVTGHGSTRSYDIPFPFAALRRRIRSYTQGAENGEVGFTETLIPFSRALPRLAAAPEFFRYPRIVLAVDKDFLSSTRPHQAIMWRPARCPN